MMLWKFFGAAATLTTLASSQKPTESQMAYARTVVAIRTCQPSALDEVKANPRIVHSTKPCIRCVNRSTQCLGAQRRNSRVMSLVGSAQRNMFGQMARRTVAIFYTALESTVATTLCKLWLWTTGWIPLSRQHLAQVSEGLRRTICV